MQTSSDNSEHKSTFLDVIQTNNYLFNHTIVKTQKTPSLSIASKFSDLH